LFLHTASTTTNEVVCLTACIIALCGSVHQRSLRQHIGKQRMLPVEIRTAPVGTAVGGFMQCTSCTAAGSAVLLLAVLYCCLCSACCIRLLHVGCCCSCVYANWCARACVAVAAAVSIVPDVFVAVAAAASIVPDVFTNNRTTVCVTLCFASGT
jgi:hypothetical protein